MHKLLKTSRGFQFDLDNPEDVDLIREIRDVKFDIIDGITMEQAGDYQLRFDQNELSLL